MDVPEALVSVTAEGPKIGVRLDSKSNIEMVEPVSIKNTYVLQPILALTLSGNPTVARLTDCPLSFPTFHDTQVQEMMNEKMGVS